MNQPTSPGYHLCDHTRRISPQPVAAPGFVRLIRFGDIWPGPHLTRPGEPAEALAPNEAVDEDLVRDGLLPPARGISPSSHRSGLYLGHGSRRGMEELVSVSEPCLPRKEVFNGRSG